MTRNPRRLVALTATVLLLQPSTAAAHAVHAEVTLTAGTATVAVFYDDETPGDDSTVKVTDADGKVVAEGKTDATGKWSFPSPPPGTYKVAIDAGAGHRATRTLTIPPIAPEDAIISDGPTRADSTGPMRLVWALAGVLAIGLATWVVRLVLKTRREYPPPASRHFDP